MSKVETGKLFELVERMPPFSPTVTKIIALANDLNSSPSDLVSTISTDPVLTAKLFKLINSAYFGLRQPIVSLQRAVIMLGYNTVKNVTLSLSVAGGIKVRDSKWFSSNQFWEHSLGCAVASKALAARAGIRSIDLEEYFIAGLLHDIGVTLLSQSFREECEEIYAPGYAPGKTRVEIEKEALGVSHDEVGGLVARQWKFPETLATAISGHHSPLNGPEEGLFLRLVVHIANHFCNEKKISIYKDAIPDSISDEAWSAFPLSREETAEALENLEETVNEAKVFLQIVES